MPSSHFILCCPLLLLPPIPPSIRVFSNESTLRMRWPKYWSFSFSIIPSKEIPGLISFRMYWLDLLAVQGTLKSLLQHHSSKASILQRWCTLHISQISRVTIYSLDVILYQFGISLLFHVQFLLLLADLHIGFSRVRSGGLVFPSPSECSTVYCGPHSQRLWHSQ